MPSRDPSRLKAGGPAEAKTRCFLTGKVIEGEAFPLVLVDGKALRKLDAARVMAWVSEEAEHTPLSRFGLTTSDVKLVDDQLEVAI